MIFEIGKTYIVDVTEKGITPSMEFDKDRWFDKDHDDLDFLTDAEKVIVINTVLDKIRADIQFIKDKCLPNNIAEEYEQIGLQEALDIIDKYKGK